MPEERRNSEDDKDFEVVVLVDDERLAADVLKRVRNQDIMYAKKKSSPAISKVTIEPRK